MLKAMTQFKSTISSFENIFHFDSACPTNVAKESVLECLKWIGQIEDQAKAAQAEALKKMQEEAKTQTDTIPELIEEPQESYAESTV